MRLRVVYEDPARLLAAHDEQFVRGGLFVYTPPPANVQLRDAVDLSIVLPDGQEVSVKGEVLQVAAGSGIAVGFVLASAPVLKAAVAKARAEIAARPAVPGETPVFQRMEGATAAAKVQLALHGNCDERLAIVRDLNKTLHVHVLRNPQIRMEEVVVIAKMATVSAEALKTIAERREWFERSEVAIALARNPAVSLEHAIKMLDHMPKSDLGRMAKDRNVRGPVQAAARKKMLR